MENVSLNFGPLAALLSDDSVTEIMVNHFRKIFVEKSGSLLPTSLAFESEQSLQKLIHDIAKSSGREISQDQPYMDAYLPNGARVNASIPPMVSGGACLTIRKFRKSPFTLEQYIQLGTLSHKAAFFLHACISARLNMIVSGGTGTGKTTFLNALSALISPEERVISIEDVAELNLQLPNWVRLESVLGKPNMRGVSTRDCLINALRMRPDRIIVGECRRDETFEMLQAMNTGHDGSMTTVHANSSRDCLTRIESLILTSSVELPLTALRRQICSAVDVVIQLKRSKNGVRVVQEIVELTGVEQNTITTQTLFSREKSRGNKASPPSGDTELLASGLAPTFMQRFSDAGIQFPQGFFDPSTQVTYRAD
jgi:pilus assembly protein CpaF